MKQRLKTEILGKKVTNQYGLIPNTDTLEFEVTLQKLVDLQH